MAETIYRHPRSINERVFEVWRSPDRFTKNPDMVQLSSGRLMLVYSDNDQHWSQETQVLTLLASDDLGQTWFKFKEVATADLRKGDERLVTPRLSLLNDGRLVVLIDHDDFGHFHEDQGPGNWAFWSEDDGESWSGPQLLEIAGFEPDRMMDLPDGRLAVCSQVMRRDTQEFVEILNCSDDNGKSWYEAATMAGDGYFRYCEGALVVLDGGKELALVMRENHSAGIPSFVTFSQDDGKSWSPAQMLPFAIHRPYAKQLPDGRVFVTGRHVNGGLGTYGWVGDLHAEADTYSVGGPRAMHKVDLTSEEMCISSGPGLDCRYSLMPPESARSAVLYESEVRVESETDDAAAFLSLAGIAKMWSTGGLVLSIGRKGIWLGDDVDNYRAVDMTVYRTVKIHHQGGLLQVSVDGKVLINQCIFRETVALAEFHGGDRSRRTQFGQGSDHGTSYWRRVRYQTINPTIADFAWEWQASNGLYPDDYQRRRLIQIHANDASVGWPDNGYSSWVLLPDGRIMFVDYTNLGDPQGKSHLVGAYITMEDLY